MIPLEYGSITRRRHSAWTWAGMVLTLFPLLGASLLWWSYFSLRRSGGGMFNVQVSAIGYAIPIITAIICLIGAARGKRWLAVTGIVLSILSLLSLIAVVLIAH
jgi:hypothetical protein